MVEIFMVASGCQRVATTGRLIEIVPVARAFGTITTILGVVNFASQFSKWCAIGRAFEEAGTNGSLGDFDKHWVDDF